MAADYKSLQQILQNPMKGKHYTSVIGSVGWGRSKDKAYTQWYDTNIAPLMKPVTQGGAIGPDRYNGFLATPSGIERSLAERGKQKDPYKALVSMYNSLDALATDNPEAPRGGMGNMDYYITSTAYQAALGYQYFKDTLPPELKFLGDAKVASKKYGAQNKLGNANNLIAEMKALVPYGYNVGTKAGDNNKMISRLAPDLARYGVNSLSDLTSYSVTNPYTGKKQDIFYNTKTNTIIPNEFGSSMKGEGGTWFQLMNVGGKVIPVTKWSDTSNAADYAGVVMVAGLVAAPLMAGLSATISGALGGGVVGNIAGAAVTSGLTQGTLSALSGGDFGKGFLTGALTGGVGAGVGALNVGTSVANQIAPLGNTAAEASLNAAISSGINKALAGGLSAAIGSAVNGGDSGISGVSGAVAGAVSGVAGEYLGNQIGGALGSVTGKLTNASLTGTGGQQTAAPAATSTGGQQTAAPAATSTSTTAPATTSGYGTSSGLLGAGGYGKPWQLKANKGVGLIG